MTRRRHDIHVVFEAIRFGKRAARRDCVELVTHARTDRIRSKDSYGREGRQRDSER
jgi:hypothetical protein